MKKLIGTLLLLALAFGLLTSCSGLLGPRQVGIPLTKLQASVDRRFPMNNRLLDLFEIELSRPQLALMPDTGRIGVALDATVTPPLTRKTWRGNMGLSGRLYIDAARNAVLMAEPRVDAFVLDGIDPARQQQLAELANILMEKVAADLIVYSFRPEDLRYAGIQFVPTRIATTASGLVVTVEPAK